ncbi:MAG: methionine--tRNA ligase subunit beta [Candidatus Omnitrophica bacterium]|nr:methionine--tRNA ligase subunit beta [Candidatus Omnitrophota bacterium]
MVRIKDFMEFDLRVAKIIEAKDHPNADRLFVLKIDTGEEQRQLVAGIRSSYTAEQLIGKQVVFISNLEPAVIRGEESRGMILAASDETGIAIVSPEREMALGSRIK